MTRAFTILSTVRQLGTVFHGRGLARLAAVVLKSGWSRHCSWLPSVVILILLAAGLWPPTRALSQGADSSALRPYQIQRDQPTKLPQIVPAVHGKDLYIAWQVWGADQKASSKVYVHKVGLT